ncbi:hypothetical protein [Clostridium sp. ZS2-4]|uniref:hypothetical protein n=1 Tax=Clostridium sp. ZS2-4 TaxID=2987703 RepID=UPI00227B9A2B|nr:hypothetical protein [Clostridium sp. ZS2-4]MCY6355324.1 hypothetical protein [Clostridium sp. ZS2-4]
MEGKIDKKQKNKLWMFLKLLLSITFSLNLIGCMNSAEDKRIPNREKTKVQEYLKLSSISFYVKI